MSEKQSVLDNAEANADLVNTPSKMDIFSKRPILAIVLSLALILIGIRAAMKIARKRLQNYPLV